MINMPTIMTTAATQPIGAIFQPGSPQTTPSTSQQKNGPQNENAPVAGHTQRSAAHTVALITRGCTHKLQKIR